ncbi:MAG: Crossover junction endodeoxyribonuclease RuvC [Candidatus Moranbacteria bacterium GW2011_GWE2_35_2-]|nr:MAG: Crossover junction endodeoxyribonuclease RuvC [Candidatus Moranbacteria bacterium GW2011_GWE2_35_2-]KKQ05511.1 MAG: Crossover junction endodeoxyribonuclease RuvC [Candidatus Moranbacteria bacterium GW2011_GWF1_36_4]KKQ22637.1 MAG: Crossover junction endodeoxyribonuclease RuvC [Candidatus Moranbacteria bacterium GW2011_GWF2_37_11]KKQ29039.1 MAG: Crossover junction endodeoxyribonuclease RuvC [Candidatus Moranbacteria bacterium GW2011_GWD1_37_17]KKQ30425.1 MAG: Crossover junction endodeoxy
MLRILGIDPGTATTGWAILEEDDGKIVPIAYGHISTSPKRSTSERIKEVADDIENIIRKYSPTEGVVEDLFFFKNIKTVMKVSQSRGGILLALEKMGLKIFEYTPLQVKQALTGYGRAEKKQIQIMVKSILKLKEIPKPDDTADAIAIAICHLNSRKMNNF